MKDVVFYKEGYEPFLGGDDEPKIGYQQSYMDPKKAQALRKEQKKHRKEKRTNWSTESAYYSEKTEWSSSQAYGDPRLPEGEGKL